MGRYSRILLIVVLLMAVLVASLFAVYQTRLKETEISVNTTLSSEIPGYEVNWLSENTFKEFLKETNFYSVEHIDKERKSTFSTDSISITLTNKELPLYQIYYSDGIVRELSYATDYSSSGNKLEIFVYIRPQLLEDTSAEMINSVNRTVNAQIIRTLLMSMKSLPGQKYASLGEASDDYVKKLVYDKDESELPFHLAE